MANTVTLSKLAPREDAIPALATVIIDNMGSNPLVGIQGLAAKLTKSVTLALKSEQQSLNASQQQVS